MILICTQIPRDDVLRYSLAVVKELFDPLEACYRGLLEGSGALATLLLCETLLSLLPSMSLHNMPYQLLRHYEIAPFTSGVISRERRLVLFKFATIHCGVLFLRQPVMDRVFVPLRQVPPSGRRQVIRMLEFLEMVGTNSRQQISKKAANILVDCFLNQLVKSQLIPRLSVLTSTKSLVLHGGGVYSVISSEVYVRRVFNPNILPSHHRFFMFLRTALDLTSEAELYTELSNELLNRVAFVPRVILHESQTDISSTAFHVLSSATLGYIKNKAKIRPLTEEELMPLMKGVEMHLIRSFDMQHQRTRQLTR